MSNRLFAALSRITSSKPQAREAQYQRAMQTLSKDALARVGGGSPTGKWDVVKK